MANQFQQALAAGWRHFVEQQHQAEVEPGQRRTQLVRHRIEQLALLVDVPLKVAGHGIEHPASSPMLECGEMCVRSAMCPWPRRRAVSFRRSRSRQCGHTHSSRQPSMAAPIKTVTPRTIR